MTIAIRLGTSVVHCHLATTPAEQRIGLSKHSSLQDGSGMIFPFDPPRSAAFHMDQVPFAIDIIGVATDGRVNRIVERALPGSTESWTFPKSACVIEVPGGWCRSNAVGVGTRVAMVRAGYHRSNQDFPAQDETHNQIVERESKDSIEQHRDKEVPHASQEFNPASEYWSEVWGRDLANDAINIDPEPPLGRNDSNRAVHIGQIVDESKFVETTAEVVMGNAGRMQWTPDRLNGGQTERAVVTRRELAQWLNGRVSQSGLRIILDAAATDRGLSLIGDAFILADIADMANVSYQDGSSALVLRRGLTT